MLAFDSLPNVCAVWTWLVARATRITEELEVARAVACESGLLSELTAPLCRPVGAHSPRPVDRSWAAVAGAGRGGWSLRVCQIRPSLRSQGKGSWQVSWSSPCVHQALLNGRPLDFVAPIRLRGSPRAAVGHSKRRPSTFWVQLCMWACVCSVYMHVRTCAPVFRWRVHVCTRVKLCVHVCACTWACACVCIHTHVCTHVYVCVHTCVSCIPLWARSERGPRDSTPGLGPWKTSFIWRTPNLRVNRI